MIRGLADERSDVYGLGAVAFLLLTGRPVFEGGTVAELCLRVMKETAPRVSAVSDQEIPPALDELVARCLERDPDARPAGMRDVHRELVRLAGEFPWSTEEADRWWAAHAEEIAARLEKLNPPRSDTGPSSPEASSDR